MKAPLTIPTPKNSMLPDGHPISAASMSGFVLAHLDHVQWIASGQRTKEGA